MLLLERVIHDDFSCGYATDARCLLDLWYVEYTYAFVCPSGPRAHCGRTCHVRPVVRVGGVSLGKGVVEEGEHIGQLQIVRLLGQMAVVGQLGLSGNLLARHSLFTFGVRLGTDLRTVLRTVLGVNCGGAQCDRV